MRSGRLWRGVMRCLLCGLVLRMSFTRRSTGMDRTIPVSEVEKAPGEYHPGASIPASRREVVSGGLDHRPQAPGADVPALCLPSMTTTLDWMFGLNMRFVRRLEKLTLWPNLVVLPQTSHLPATSRILPL